MSSIEILMTIFCAICGSTGIWTTIQTIVQKKNEKESVERLALKGVLHSLLYSKCKYYIDKGELTVDEFEDLTEMYVPYVKLGGNGTIKKLYEIIAEELVKK